MQRAAFSTLMPNHAVQQFGLQQQGAQLSLYASTRTVHYLVVRGQAYAPGVDFEARTPARAALLNLALVLGGAVTLIRVRRLGVSMERTLARLGFQVALTVAAIAVVAVVLPALVLAGAQWGLAVEAFEEPSAAALLVGASDLILHGGNLAICMALVWALNVDRGDGLTAR